MNFINFTKQQKLSKDYGVQVFIGNICLELRNKLIWQLDAIYKSPTTSERYVLGNTNQDGEIYYLYNHYYAS